MIARVRWKVVPVAACGFADQPARQSKGASRGLLLLSIRLIREAASGDLCHLPWTRLTEPTPTAGRGGSRHAGTMWSRRPVTPRVAPRASTISLAWSASHCQSYAEWWVETTTQSYAATASAVSGTLRMSRS
jgi:hypothetical protein